MRSISLSLVAAFAGTALATECSHDNVLRCHIGSSAVASPYCSSVLSIPIATVIVATSTPVTQVNPFGTSRDHGEPCTDYIAEL